ncbi:hypothetical protein GYN08_16540 [Saccharibacillus sp. VR-M41]|uniref:Cysteine-rich CPCC domain-containing protein n=1 Tax=Saccharibacillus alkalitolerans TaxID=2705290 RepID=A0ABX0FCB2_9BACL|nr:hypothetical protein [Saccharibacillus alkalitolerans]
MKFACPCCGYRTLTEEPPGSYDICGICFWEDDAGQFYDPDNPGGANKVSLREAQENFAKFGACEEQSIPHVRKPRPSDVYEGPLDVSKVCRMPIEELIRLFAATGTPLTAVLDLYKGLIRVEGSNFRFNSAQLRDYLSEEESWEYTMLMNRDNPNVRFGDKRVYELSPSEAEENIRRIRDRFVQAVQEKHRL